MQFTTRAKLTLKKALPTWLFTLIKATALVTILKIQPLVFSFRTRDFNKRQTVPVRYAKGNFDLVIDPRNGFLDAQIYTRDYYEPHIVAEFINNIEVGDTCIDIGANIGHHTIIMSQLTGSGGKVIAFEPIPFIREQLTESLHLNNVTNVQVLPEALADHPGILNLHINRENVAGSSFVNEQRGEKVEVEIRALDSYAFTKVDFIKLDVEGFEYPALLGATETIAAKRPIVLFEFSPVYYLKSNPAHTRDIITFFLDKNYRLIDLEDNRKAIVDVDSFVAQFAPGMRSQTNILALPN